LQNQLKEKFKLRFFFKMSRKLKRVIARLDVKGPNIVKGVQMEGLRVLGDPEEFAEYYYNQGADEIIFSDIVASLYGRNSLLEVVSKTAKNIFIPLTVGGGIRSLKDINDLLRAGADKISLNSAAIKNPQLIDDAVKEFGASTITIAIEVNWLDKKYEILYNNGRELANIDLEKWLIECQERGAGEILLTAIHRDGTGQGFDTKLIDQVNKIVKVPLIVQGGAGSINDIKKIISYEIDGVVLSSALHYTKIAQKKNTYKDTSSEGNKEFIKNKKTFLNFKNLDIQMIKQIVDLNV
tara:strand:+ start:1770 stop:2654 length:885 start_codon:yes stop_codon:yes gene_type:complete